MVYVHIYPSTHPPPSHNWILAFNAISDRKGKGTGDIFIYTENQLEVRCIGILLILLAYHLIRIAIALQLVHLLLIVCSSNILESSISIGL